MVIAAVIIGLGTATTALGAGGVTSLACGLLLVVGLPHGALDIAEVRAAKVATQLAVIGAYLAAATTMFAVWMVSPLAGLAAFYAVAIAHFAEDWDQAGQAFFGHAIAVALLAAPVVLHTDELRALFVTLTNDPRAALLVDFLILAAPVAIAVALVGLATVNYRRRSAEWICALAAMLVLPPVPGFAVFFCLFHSPRHFREGWAKLEPQVQPGAPAWIAAMTVAGFGIAALIFMANSWRGVPAGLLAASMMTLAVLTVPHMLLPTILRLASKADGRGLLRPSQ